MNMFTEQVQPSSRRLQLERTRSAVIDAARRLFQEHGYEGTSVRDIASAAGVSVGTVMNVGNKEGLLVLVFSTIIDARDRHDDGAVQPTEPSACERLERIFHDYVDTITSRGELARSWGGALLHDDSYVAGMETLRESLMGEVTAAVGDLMPPDRADRVAEQLYTNYLGQLFAWGIGIRTVPEIHAGMAALIADLLAGAEHR